MNGFRAHRSALLALFLSTLLALTFACHTNPGEEGEPLLDVPNEPPPLPAHLVMSDEPFMQEFNHTLNENPAEVGELVALVMPPEEYADFDRPTLVAPRGIWFGGLPGSTDAPRLLEIPPGASDVVDAGTAGGAIWLLTGDALFRVAVDESIEPVGGLPAGAEPYRLEAAGEGVYVLTSHALGWVDGAGDPVWYDFDPGPTALRLRGDRLFLAWPDTLAAFATDDSSPEPGAEAWRVDLDAGTPVAILTDRTLPQPLDLVVVGTRAPAGFTLTETSATPVDVPLFACGRVPLDGAVTAVEASNGGFVVAAEGGAYRVVEEGLGPEYRVYVPDRWMPHGDVRDLLEDTDTPLGELYFATQRGLGSVTRAMWTLEEKSDSMIERIVLRHDRDGAVADSRLSAPGDLSTSIPWDSDNDGGWTCYWILSECFRYALTGAEDAKANFDKSLERMLSFRTLTGTDTFLARSVIRIEGCILDDCDDPDDGEWFLSPDEEWWVKADTSNDEVTSHMFMMGHAYDVCADDDQREAIAEHVDGIVGGIIDNGYQLIDPQDCKPTTHGQFDPFYVNIWPAGSFADGGRRSAQMLGAINLAYYLTGKERYLDAKDELIEEHHYDENVAKIGLYPFCAGSGDCDELAYQAFVPLLRYEWDPELREKWLGGWRRLYMHLATQEDAFWDLGNAAFGEPPVDLSRGKRYMQRYPTDLVRWNIRNHVRMDMMPPPFYYLVKEPKVDFRMRSDRHIIPADERRNIRHNTPQFSYAGGWGSLRELDGGDALYPYWLGRYYGFIAEP